MNYYDPNPTLTKLLIVVGVVFVIFLITLIRIIYRSKTMKRFATEHQFQWLGKELPDALYLRKTSFALRETKIANSIVGDLRGNQIAIFDIAYDLPKEGGRQARTVTQTVIAFRNAGSLRCQDTPSTGKARFHLEVAGDWIIAYTEGKTISASKLDEKCADIYGQAVVLIQRLPALKNA